MGPPLELIQKLREELEGKQHFTDTQSMRRKKIADENMCSICCAEFGNKFLEADLFTCGHEVCCKQCGGLPVMRTCPICRKSNTVLPFVKVRDGVLQKVNLLIRVRKNLVALQKNKRPSDVVSRIL